MTNFLTHYLENKDKPWDYYELCGNPQVNLDTIKEFPQVYNFTLSDNINLTWDYIVEKKGKVNWCWDRISANPCVTWDIVCNNPYELWDYNGLSENPNITWENILSSLYKPWNTSILSKHPCITWDIIQSKISWRNLEEKNTKVTEEIINNYPEKYVSKEAIRKEFLKAHFNGNFLKIAQLIENTFGKGSFRTLGMMNTNDETIRRVNASYSIQPNNST